MRTLLLALAAIAAIPAFLFADTTTPLDPASEIQSIEQRVEAQNLINGLGLTGEQLDQLVALGEETKALREQLATENKALFDRLFSNFQRLSAALANGPEISPEIAQEFHRSEQEAKQTLIAFQREMSERTKRVSAILTPEQIEVVRTFEPCTLPPKDQKEPVRAGQSSENARAEKMLDRVRAMEDARFATLKEEIVGRLLDGYEAGHQPFTEEERASETARILTELTRIHGMKDADYEMNKRDLVAALKPRDRAKELGEEAANLRAERLGGDADRERLVRYFLSAEACAALEAKAFAVKGYVPGTPTDLKSKKPADGAT